MKAAIVMGVPEPSFKPRSSLSSNNNPVSPSGTEFMRTVLCRNPADRPSARTLLGTNWFQNNMGQMDQSGTPPTFRPMLYSAKRAGAFDTRNPCSDDKFEMDVRLQALQRDYHPHHTITTRKHRERGERTNSKQHEEGTTSASTSCGGGGCSAPQQQGFSTGTTGTGPDGDDNSSRSASSTARHLP
mmetsp:Transcript_125846/g.268471  ORF Transcript_125846/g.268471 Transcript_125846/m.268471 type:complete len:186 (-) Transcript_125846:54-611(-)